MIPKIFLLASFVVLLCDAKKGHYIRDIVIEVCKGDELHSCKESAKKCIPPFKEENRVEFQEKHCKIFGTCLDKVTGSRSIHDTFIEERHHGRDWCASPRDENSSEEDKDETRRKPIGQMHHKRMKFRKEKFEDFLNKTSTTEMVSEFKCCVAKEKGMFNEDGSVNVSFWKGEAAKFVNPAVKASFETGIDSCAATNESCDMLCFTANMATKEILFLWMVLVYCHGRKGPYGRNFINHLCTGSAPEVKKCKDIAAKCIVRPKLGPIGTSTNLHELYCKTFDTCLEQTNGTRAFYETYLQERQGRNRCPLRKTFGIKNETNFQVVNGTKLLPTTESKVKVKPVHGMTFEDYLVQVSGANVTAQFVCCFAKANGKFNDNGTVNVAPWKAEAAILEDIALKSVIEKSIDNCVIQETSCSVSDFKQCVVANCYNSIKQTSRTNITVS